MQFASLVFLAASASATATLDMYPAQYINDFVAACVPHSTYCNYRFGVTPEPGIVPATQCMAHLQGPDRLPEIVDRNDCNLTVGIPNPAYHWSLMKTPEGGLAFKVWFPFNSRSNLTFCYNICAEDLVIDNNGAVQTQRYKGYDTFKMDLCSDQCRH